MANDDIFFENDVIIDVNLDNAYIIDQGAITKVVAHKYSSESTYNIGDYAIYRNELYKCVADISTHEEFDPTKWTKLFVVDELKNIYSILPTKADKSTTYTKTETDNLLDEKADKIATYTKTETDNLLNEKADKNATYTKTETDNLLNEKADKSTTYTKTDTDTLLNIKADKSTTYTKTEVDTALANKANSADVYTKTETYSKTEVDTDIYKKTETYSKTEVDNKIDNLPTPMQFKGTLGTSGTITDLPTASLSNNGFTYKVITDGTYASIPAKVGDMFTSNGSEWVHIPSGDETFTDTWRGIKVNGTEKLGSSINTGSVDFKDGTNSTAVFDQSDSSIKFNVDGYTQAQVDTKLADKANASDVYAKSETYSQAEVDSKLLVKADSSDVYTKQETYTKTEVNTALSEKADTSTVTTALTLKADKADTYTKEEVDDLIDIVGTASGRIATFKTNLADVLQSLKCEVNAKQDLHGYDHPWAGGAGKNKLHITATSQTINGITYTVKSDGTITANGTATAESTLVLVNGTGIFDFTTEMVLNGSVDGFGSSVRTRFGVSGVGSYDDFGNGVTIPIISDISARYSYVQITIASGTTVNNVTFKPMISTTGGDFEPYSNICPLVGHSELNLTRCGKNLLDDTCLGYYTDEITLPAGTYYFKGFISTTGTDQQNTRFYWLDDTNTWQIITASGSFDNGAITWTGSAFGWESGTFYATVTLTKNETFRMSCSATTANTRRVGIFLTNVDTFEPYNGQTFTVSFGQTVYGGVYDKSGRLTIDTVKVVLNGTQPIGMVNWNPNTNTRAWIYFLTTFPHLKDYEIKDSNISSCKLKADKLQTVTYKETNGISTNDIPSISIVGGDYWSIVVRVNDTTLENETAINNYLSQNPIEVVYELATPIVIDVPSISVFAENGTNNIVSDGGGDVIVEYFKGMAEEIEEVFKNSNFVDLSDIPDLPNTDGSYRLNLTIANGVPVYSWEEITE